MQVSSTVQGVQCTESRGQDHSLHLLRNGTEDSEGDARGLSYKRGRVLESLLSHRPGVRLLAK